MRVWRPTWLAVLLFCSFSSRAPAEFAHVSYPKPSWLSIGIAHRSRYEALSNSFRREETQDDQQVAQRTRLRAQVHEITKPFSSVVELQDSRIHLDAGEALTSTAFVNKTDFLQHYVDFSPEKPLWRDLVTRVKFGRFTQDLGKRRLFARNQMRNTTNSFEGLNWALEGADIWDIQLFLMQPVLRETREKDNRDRHSTVLGGFLERE